jgi:phosphatidylinositol alpha-mannosyltransferase
VKIAQVCPYDFSRPGGVKSHILSLTKYLKHAGHDVVIIAPNINSSLVTEEDVHFFGSNRSVNLGGTKIDVNIALGSQWKDLKSFLNGQQFDIIHYHTIWNPLLPFQIRWLSKAKQVATFHDTPKNYFVGKWIVPLISKIVFQFLDVVISVSASQAKLISRFSRRGIHIIPNGIDLDLPERHKKKTDKKNLLFLGRLEPRKGVMHAVKTFVALQKDYPDLELRIAGDGDERQLVEEYVRKNDIQGVQLLGFVSEQKKYELLHEADIYLATALYGESFGIVLLEAMSMGCPIAGYANDGYLNVISDSMKKYFALPGDNNSLIDRTALLLKDRPSQEALIAEGYQIAQKYDWGILTGDIEQLYRD